MQSENQYNFDAIPEERFDVDGSQVLVDCLASVEARGVVPGSGKMLSNL